MDYGDYVWRNGSPYGIGRYKEEEGKKKTAYKIASDPYHKRISLEKYEQGNFSGIIYDSALFDFRQLKLGEQLAWQKISVEETENHETCHIRNQDDRLILIEKYLFENGLCKECKTFSPLGILLSVQKITYKKLNGPFDGVTLYDSNHHPIMRKHYEFDENLQAFTALLKEEWTFLI